ncbi:hypothetical protein [Sphingomonas gilva]|uniref:hypothetical protein n=1 Tax=Sphingomonas gilva TaxID=2305907 RepID=UPI0015F78EF9|nr:hypothetical protein [Sphingomonas gilva]
MDDAVVKTGIALEAVAAMLEALAKAPDADPRSIALTRTQFETAFLWAASAVQGKGVLS